MKRLLLLLIILFHLVSCDKEKDPAENKVPASYNEMFEVLRITPNETYNYFEVINNQPTGNKGTIRFSLSDTSITETFNASTTKDRFRLDSLHPYSCKFISLGRNKYPQQQSQFINNARRNISYVNNITMVSFDSIYNGSYYYYQYIISK